MELWTLSDFHSPSASVDDGLITFLVVIYSWGMRETASSAKLSGNSRFDQLRLRTETFIEGAIPWRSRKRELNGCKQLDHVFWDRVCNDQNVLAPLNFLRIFWADESQHLIVRSKFKACDDQNGETVWTDLSAKSILWHETDESSTKHGKGFLHPPAWSHAGL
jgi:hypothetical protein